jgi:mannose-6-phosphate isomerase
MTATKLTTRSVIKPWGRTSIPPLFPNPDREKIGEIWFEGPGDRHPPLLVKYIFTSEKLSVQVHPTDAQARARGLPGGKSECWYILDADPGATLGMGVTQALDEDELRVAAQDGSIEQMIDWKPVAAGDFFYIGAGTIHAIGGGITLIEVQQNNDVTYRLYDYGRPRELHLDDGVAVSRSKPFPIDSRNLPLGEASRLVDGAGKPFTLEMVAWGAGGEIDLSGDPLWFVPISGSGLLGEKPWQKGECWLIEGDEHLRVAESTAGMLARLP